jgi:hypothetical protein
MRIGRTILAFWVALSLAMLPMARPFVIPGDEAMASEVVVASAHGCDHAAMDSDVVVASAHDCCDQESMPTASPSAAISTQRYFHKKRSRGRSVERNRVS